MGNQQSVNHAGPVEPRRCGREAWSGEARRSVRKNARGVGKRTRKNRKAPTCASAPPFRVSAFPVTRRRNPDFRPCFVRRPGHIVTRVGLKIVSGLLAILAEPRARADSFSPSRKARAEAADLRIGRTVCPPFTVSSDGRSMRVMLLAGAVRLPLPVRRRDRLPADPVAPRHGVSFVFFFERWRIDRLRTSQDQDDPKIRTLQMQVFNRLWTLGITVRTCERQSR